MAEITSRGFAPLNKAPWTGKVHRAKSFTGCWRCRERKIKCDEAFPSCSQCTKCSVECSYAPVLVWVESDHHHKLSYQPGQRRILRSDLTWKGYRVLKTQEVSALLALLDAQDFTGLFNTTDVTYSAGPFVVFASARPEISTQISYSISQTETWDSQISRLFDHYVKQIAPNMMPFEDIRNPWKSLYPQLARSREFAGQKALFNAMLAQSAGNLATMGIDVKTMSLLTLKHYSEALKYLRESIVAEETEFSTVLASVLTLIMAESYSGRIRTWRVHLDGAWKFLTSQIQKRPWLESDASWVIAQSLCLLRIRSATSSRIPTQSTFDQQFIDSISFRDDFGFTAGATPQLMTCVSAITSLAKRMNESVNSAENFQQDINKLYDNLLRCHIAETTCQSTTRDVIQQRHHSIFYTGAYIYFHRTILGLRPRNLVNEVSTLLHDVDSYQSLGGGHVTLWPVFIAAIEVYREEDKRITRAWLNLTRSSGVASRSLVCDFIEDVWQIRSERALVMGMEEGDVIVDWMEIMAEKHLDLLLV